MSVQAADSEVEGLKSLVASLKIGLVSSTEACNHQATEAATEAAESAALVEGLQAQVRVFCDT